jgi:hypothetical protein
MDQTIVEMSIGGSKVFICMWKPLFDFITNLGQDLFFHRRWLRLH